MNIISSYRLTYLVSRIVCTDNNIYIASRVGMSKSPSLSLALPTQTQPDGYQYDHEDPSVQQLSFMHRKPNQRLQRQLSRTRSWKTHRKSVPPSSNSLLWDLGTNVSEAFVSRLILTKQCSWIGRFPELGSSGDFEDAANEAPRGKLWQGQIMINT